MEKIRLIDRQNNSVIGEISLHQIVRFITTADPEIIKNLDVTPFQQYFCKMLGMETKRYINHIVNNALGEDLSDLSTEIQDIEGNILYYAVLDNIKITIDEIKQKIILYLAGRYTDQQAIQELKEKGFTDAHIQEILKLLQRAVEIAKIIRWKEEIWKKEEELEKQIEQIDNIEELINLDIQETIEKEYSVITQKYFNI